VPIFPRFADPQALPQTFEEIIKQGVIHFDFVILLKQFEFAISQSFTQIKYLDSACPLCHPFNAT
jgi:hypothetical protein